MINNIVLMGRLIFEPELKYISTNNRYNVSYEWLMTGKGDIFNQN